jgi:hypothetical protein
VTERKAEDGGIVNNLSYEEWEIIGFTPLSDWVNVYHGPLRGHFTAEDCPGVLLQESIHTVNCWDEDKGGGKIVRRSETKEHVRETRAMFATGCEGELLNAGCESNYYSSMSLREFHKQHTAHETGDYYLRRRS